MSEVEHSLLVKYQHNNPTRFIAFMQFIICLVQSELIDHIETKVMCNGNDYISKVMVMVMITFPKSV